MEGKRKEKDEKERGREIGAYATTKCTNTPITKKRTTI
jgi:hypothetical protein